MWSGNVLDGSQLIINEHSLSLNYGTLLLTLLEKVALPQIFDDPAVNSIEALLDEIIGCESLGIWFNDNVLGGTSSLVENLCGQLKTTASDALYDYVETLVLDGAESFLIGTPDGQTCQLFGPETYPSDWSSYPLPYVERMGEAPPSSLVCNWSVKIRYSEGSAPLSMDGTFHGGLE